MSYISPDRYFVGAGACTDVIVYNTKLVPPERIPRRWEDCLDPSGEGSSSSTAGAAVLSVCIPRGEKKNFLISPGAWRLIWPVAGSPVILTP